MLLLKLFIYILDIVGVFSLKVLYNVGHDINATVPLDPTV